MTYENTEAYREAMRRLNLQDAQQALAAGPFQGQRWSDQERHSRFNRLYLERGGHPWELDMTGLTAKADLELWQPKPTDDENNDDLNKRIERKIAREEDQRGEHFPPRAYKTRFRTLFRRMKGS